MNIDKVTKWCDSVIAFSYYAMIYFLPISIALCESFASATLFFFFIKRGFIFYSKLKDSQRTSIIQKFRLFLTSFKPVKSYLSWPMGAFIFVCALSIAKSEYLMLSLQGFFFKVLQWTFLYFVFIESIKTKRQLQIFATVFLISATLVSINGIVQFFTGHGFIFGHLLAETAGRVNSSFRHPNDFGAYLITVCPISLCLFIHYSFLPRKITDQIKRKSFAVSRSSIIGFLLLIISIVAITCLGLTYSRGAWVGFFIALLLLALGGRKNLRISFPVIILFLCIFSPLLEDIRNVSFISDDVQKDELLNQQELLGSSLDDKNNKKLSGSLLYNKKNNDARFLLNLKKPFEKIKRFGWSGRSASWRSPLRIIKGSPFLGTGVNTYSQISREFNPILSHPDNFWGGYPHNSYLHMAAEIGLVGLGVFLWIALILIRNSIRNLRLIDDSYLRNILIGLLAGLIGFLIHSFIDTHFYSVQLGNLMWVLMGTIVATQRIGLQQNEA